MKLLYLLPLSASLFAMEVKLAPLSKKLTYGTLCEKLEKFELFTFHKIVHLDEKTTQRKAYKLLQSLKLNDTDSIFVSECLKGRFDDEDIPSSIVVRDLGIYFSVLCSHDQLACKLFNIGNKDSQKFLHRLFCLAEIKKCPGMVKLILKGVALRNSDAITEYFVMVSPVLFYKNDRDYFFKVRDLLGKENIKKKSQEMLLAAFDNDIVELERLGVFAEKKYNLVLVVILLGYAMRKDQDIVAFIKVLEGFQKLKQGNSSFDMKRFYQRLAVIAQEVGSEKIGTYLQKSARL